MRMVRYAVAGLLIYNSDIIFLRVLGSAEAVGYYAAAYTLLSFIAKSMPERSSSARSVSRRASPEDTVPG